MTMRKESLALAGLLVCGFSLSSQAQMVPSELPLKTIGRDIPLECLKYVEGLEVPENIKDASSAKISDALSKYLLCWVENRIGTIIQDSDNRLSLELQKFIRDIGVPFANQIKGRTGDLIAGGYYGAKVLIVDKGGDNLKSKLKVEREGKEGIQLYNLTLGENKIDFQIVRESFTRHNLINGWGPFGSGNIRLYRRTQIYPIHIYFGDGKVLEASLGKKSSKTTRVTIDGNGDFMKTHYHEFLSELKAREIELNEIPYMDAAGVTRVAETLRSDLYKQAPFKEDEIKNMISGLDEHRSWIQKFLGTTPDLDFGMIVTDRFIE